MARRRSRHQENERDFPHALDVLQREHEEDGFSAGWGLHHLPSESYILDCHTHMVAEPRKMKKVLDEFFERAASCRLRRLVALDAREETLDAFGALSKKDDRFLWLLNLRPEKPSLKLLRRAMKKPGFVGLKLHNSRILKGEIPLDSWRKPAWDQVFASLADAGKTVLWHVTQRMTACPYMGGGLHSYWKDGWKVGVDFGNKELMEVFLEKVDSHPDVPFIGAHHLHIGPESMAKLFRKHKNLYADLSCGNIIREGDTIREDDRLRWRKYILRCKKRLLFGTDNILGGTESLWYLWDSLIAHIRFIHQMRLTDEALELVTHGNFERLAGLEPPPINRGAWGAVRP